MTDDEPNEPQQHTMSTAELTIWKMATATLAAFIVGNALSFFVFGLQTASKRDLDDASTELSNRMQQLESRDSILEATVHEMLGELKARGIAH